MEGPRPFRCEFVTFSRRESVTGTFGLVADVDALVFDLRENSGGDAAMVAFITCRSGDDLITVDEHSKSMRAVWYGDGSSRQ